MVSYVLIAVAVSALVFTQSNLLILKVFGVLIDVVIAAAFVFTFRKMLNRKPLFVFDENGVTDYSKPEDIITLPWNQLVSVGLKAANSNDLMLNIVGYKTADQLREHYARNSPAARCQRQQSLLCPRGLRLVGCSQGYSRDL